MLPEFLIIGSMRCGTSFIAKCLRTHPDIFLPADKEVHFFDRDYDQGIEFYRDYLQKNYVKDIGPIPADGKTKLIGEATPAYLYFPEIPERIHRHLPDTKLIVSLRNPIDAAYSAYWKAYSVDERTKKMTFEEKLVQEPRLMAGGRYAEQLERYLALYPRENLHVIIYEELINDKNAEFRRLYRFLGVDEDFESPYLDQRINSSELMNGRSRLLFYTHWFFYRYLEIPSITSWLEKKNSLKIEPMADETRSRLLEEFKPSNSQLENLLNRDLSVWAK